jgi:hypothetical protein
MIGAVSRAYRGVSLFLNLPNPPIHSRTATVPYKQAAQRFV